MALLVLCTLFAAGVAFRALSMLRYQDGFRRKSSVASIGFGPIAPSSIVTFSEGALAQRP
jgi:hypothetical protein